jgi:hypothetical protein
MPLVRTQSIDTPEMVERIQIRRYRDMGPRRRLEAALALNAALDRLALAGIRARHGRSGSPETERLRLFALRLSRDQMRAAFDHDPESVDG